MSRFTSMVLAIIMSLSLCASAFAAHDDTTTYHTPMNSDNTNPYRRGAFGGSGVRVNYRNGWESEDISIYFN